MLSKEQLQFRKTGIGGSDAAGAVGMSRFSNPLEVYLSKIRDDKKPITESMERGSILEPFIKRLFEKRTGFSFKKVDNVRSDQYDFMIANLDGFCHSERAIIELKSADYSMKSEWGEEGTDDIPKEYLIQVAHYCTVTNTKKAYIGVLFGNKKLFDSYKFIQGLINKGMDINIDELECDLKIYVYSAEPLLQKKIVEREEHFWFENVKKGVLPILENYSCDDLLKVFPIGNGNKKIISSDSLIELKKLNDLKAMKKEIKLEEENLKANLLRFFEDSSILTDQDGNPLATWKNQIRRAIDSEALQKEHPEIYEKFSLLSTNRVLNLIKEKNHDQ